MRKLGALCGAAVAAVIVSACGGAEPAEQVAAQSISFPAPAGLTLADTPPSLFATATSGLAVGFESATPGVCTVDGRTLTPLAAGTCTLTATQPGNAAFAAAEPVTRSFVLTTAAQAITFIPPGNQVAGAAPVVLVATASSGLPVAFASTTPAVCSVSGSGVTASAPGSCSVVASQGGDRIYAAAPPVTQTFTVAALLLPQAITFASPGEQTFGAGAIALAATSGSGLNVVLTSLTPSVCSVSGRALTLLGAGTCSVAASQPGDGNYAAAATVTVAIAVAPAAQSISFAPIAAQTLGNVVPALAATASSGLPVSFESTTPAVCTVAGNNLTLLTAGSCTLVARQAGNVNTAAATAVSRSFAVLAPAVVPVPVAQTITFAGPGPQTLGTPAPALSATSTSGLPVVFASTTPGVCKVSGSTLTLLAAGSCSVSASQPGDAAFLPATVVTRTIVVAPAPLTAQSLNFAAPGAQTLGTAPFTLTASASSGLPVAFASTTPSTCSVTGSTLTLLAVGTCVVDASQPGDATYAAAVTVTRAFAIAAAPLTAQTITFTSPGPQTLGSTPAPLAASASSGLQVIFTSTTPGTCSVTGINTLTLLTVGTCVIDASQPGNASVAAAATVTRSFTVAPAPLLAQSINFASPGTQTLGAAPAPLAATATSGLLVSFVSTTPSTCGVTGTNTLTLLAVGTCVIEASQPGNGSYAAAPAVARSFTIASAPLTAQTISFAGPGPQTLGTPPPALAATASSALPVSFASTTPGVCSVSGNSVTLLATGTCGIEASQAGNASFSAAPSVARSFLVTQAAQSIGFTAIAGQTLGTPPPLLNATATSALTVSFSSTTPATCSVSGTVVTLLATGTCVIDANQPGDARYAAAPTVTRSFTIAPAPLLAQAITFAAPAGQTFGAAPFTLAASASSGLPVAFVSTTPAVCGVSAGTVTLVGAGTCSVDASQGGNGTYAAAATVTRSFAVAPAAQTISFADPGAQVLGVAPAALSATATSGLAVSFGTTTPLVCTVSGSVLNLVGAGTCNVQADQPGNTNYSAAPTVTRSFNVAVELFANGGFEVVGATTPANAWLAAASGYSRSTDAHSGAYSAQLSSVAFNAAVMLQNSIDQGNRPSPVVGSTPTLTFWAKGTAGGTGNVLFALRYLDAVGNIKGSSGNVFFQTSINPTTWTKITYNLLTVPAGTTAAFIEFSQAIGPIDGSNPAGLVLIDDLSLKVGP